MTRCRCRRIDGFPADRCLTRRGALRVAAGLAASTLAATGLMRSTTFAQDATPAASPAADVPDLTGVKPLPLRGELLATFESFVATNLAELGVPGAAVAVVQDGQVVFLQGFGVREVGQTAPVTGDTLLRIGSVTKSFSSMLTAILVDEGRVNWDTPLVDLLPEFALADDDLTPRITMRDAFCACTGLPRRDLEFMLPWPQMTPETMISGMAQLPLTAPYGEKYQYNNQMVAAGGFAAAVADGGAATDLGPAYAIALRDRVLNPIGMPRTTLSLSEVVAGNDYAIPHAPDLEDNAVPLPVLVDDGWLVAAAPSGGLWSSAREMARYVQTELAHGVAPDGARVVSASNLEKTWEPGAPIEFGPETPPMFAAAVRNYGLGWIAGSYGGLRLVSHTGGTYGFNSLVVFMPDTDLGLVVLTNRNGTGSTLALFSMFKLFELLFAQPPVIDAMIASSIANTAAAHADLLDHLGELDPTAVAPYLGQYVNPALGQLTLALRGDRLVFDTGGVVSTLLPRLDDSGAVVDYVFAEPPMGTNPPSQWVTLREESGQPSVTLIAKADLGEADLVYRYERTDEDAASS